MRILALEIARLALEKVREVEQEGTESEIQEYLTIARKLGGMIIQNGLIGTVMFLKKKSQSSKILDHLAEIVKWRTSVDLSNLENMSEQDYLKIQKVALEASKWLKRYAEILLRGE